MTVQNYLAQKNTNAQEEEPPSITLSADDPFALDTLHYHISRCAGHPFPDMQRLAILHSTAAQFARWLTPETPPAEPST